MATSADVPNKYDVVIDGKGYMFADAEDVKATFGFTPTFVPKQNTQGSYEDRLQDFWMTWRQKDWSGVEARRFQGRDEKTETAYWTGSNIDTYSLPGQVTLNDAVRTVSTSASELRGTAARQNDHYSLSSVVTASSTNLYELTMRVTGSYYLDLGAHGAGAQPAKFGITTDGANVYMSSTAAASVGVRKATGWTSTPAYSTFSATKSDALCFLNGTLYGLVYSTGVFQRYDTGGAATTIFTWKDAAGAARDLNIPSVGDGTAHMVPYGGDLLILLPTLNDSSELWLYDGTSPSLLWKFPKNFFAYDMAVSHGIVFVSGAYLKYGGNTGDAYQPAVLYWSNGSEGVAWKHPVFTSAATSGPPDANFPAPPITDWAGGVLWWNPFGTYMYYDVGLGSVTSVGTVQPGNGYPTLASCGTFTGMTSGNGTSIYAWPDVLIKATTGTVTSGLIDFDSSLDKQIRGIKVDFDNATSGSSTIDIAYQLNDVVSGSYTTLQTTAVSGTEYTLNSTARSVSVKLTLNRGTSTLGPVLKRVSVRAVPIQTTFRKDAFIILCSGKDGSGQSKLREGSIEPRDGLQIATDLRAVLTGSTPVSITDEFATFTGVIDAEGFQIRRVRQNEYVAVVPVREV